MTGQIIDQRHADADHDPPSATLTRDGVTLQLGPGWRDGRMHLHFAHGCGDVITSAVGDLLWLGGLCPGCTGRLPENATDADWDVCFIAAASWRQIRPPGPVVNAAYLPADAP